MKLMSVTYYINCGQTLMSKRCLIKGLADVSTTATFVLYLILKHKTCATKVPGRSPLLQLNIHSYATS